MHRTVWNWLRRQDNRDVAKMTAAALTAIVAGGWAIFTFAVDHRNHSPTQNISANSGAVAAGHDASGNNITYTSPVTRAIKP